MDDNVLIAVIGGSGLYEMKGLKVIKEEEISTPVGSPSAKIIICELEGKKVAFLPRHGRGHIYSPTEVNYRANIYALKSIGVRKIISISAVGSLKEDVHPGELLVVDQFIDRTRSRPYTFYEDGVVAHVPFGDPICSFLADKLWNSMQKENVSGHKGGTYICIEGPAFSTRAESELCRSWGGSVIGMTNYQEARLAREAELCYASLALVTDYDCWHESEDDVGVEAVLATVKKNIDSAKRVLKNVITNITGSESCGCENALEGAIMTDIEKIPAETKNRLDILIGKYVK